MERGLIDAEWAESTAGWQSEQDNELIPELDNEDLVSGALSLYKAVTLSEQGYTHTALNSPISRETFC